MPERVGFSRFALIMPERVDFSRFAVNMPERDDFTARSRRLFRACEGSACRVGVGRLGYRFLSR